MVDRVMVLYGDLTHEESSSLRQIESDLCDTLVACGVDARRTIWTHTVRAGVRILILLSPRVLLELRAKLVTSLPSDEIVRRLRRGLTLSTGRR